jgi:pyruvate,water dikinase
VLVEIAREEAGQVPEVSYGTHFFHDLVEARIIFLPVYPEDTRSRFNADFFDRAGNALVELMPEAERFSGLVRMIDVEASTGGMRAQVFADSRAQRAICFLA